MEHAPDRQLQVLLGLAGLALAAASVFFLWSLASVM